MKLYLTDKGRQRLETITQDEFIGINERFELSFLRQAEAEEDIDMESIGEIDHPLELTKKAYVQILLYMKDRGWIELVDESWRIS